MNRTLAFIRLLGLALFLGGGAAIAFVVAPLVFRTLAPDRAAAGSVVGAVLHAFEIVSLASLGAALAASLALRARGLPSLAADVALGTLLAITLTLRFPLASALSDARPAGTGPGTRFDTLHRLYEKAFGLELVIAAAALLALAPGEKKKAAES